MLLTSVIIVLREVLEAALLIAILAAVSGILGLGRRWIPGGLALGLTGAFLYSLSIDWVSSGFDGMGQEIISAAMQMLIYAMLVGLALLSIVHRRSGGAANSALTSIMAAVIALAITREGFEVLVYVLGFTGDPALLANTLMGAGIGAGIGVSTGVLVYYALRWPGLGRPLGVSLGLLALIGAGLLSQAVLLLIQADWVPSQIPLWDTSGLLSESSVTGQLMYVLVGYEATPTGIQAGFYICGMALLLVLAYLAGLSEETPSPEEGDAAE